MKLVSQYFQPMFTESEQKPQLTVTVPVVLVSVAVSITIFTKAHPMLIFSDYELHYWCSFDQQAIPVSGVGEKIRCLFFPKRNRIETLKFWSFLLGLIPKKPTGHTVLPLFFRRKVEMKAQQDQMVQGTEAIRCTVRTWTPMCLAPGLCSF